MSKEKSRNPVLPLSGILIALTQLAKIIERMPIRKAVIMLAILTSTFGSLLGGILLLHA